MAFRAGGADFAGAKTQKWRTRERALCVRQNWGHRAKSYSLPLLIRLVRLSRTKPRGRACIRRLRRPYAVQKKRIESDGSQPAKADSALPSHLLLIMETARLSNAPLQRQALCFDPVHYFLGIRDIWNLLRSWR